MAKNEDVPPSTREITDSASFGDNCCATAERKLFVDLDGTVAWNSGQKKKKRKVRKYWKGNYHFYALQQENK